MNSSQEKVLLCKIQALEKRVQSLESYILGNAKTAEKRFEKRARELEAQVLNKLNTIRMELGLEPDNHITIDSSDDDNPPKDSTKQKGSTNGTTDQTWSNDLSSEDEETNGASDEKTSAREKLARDLLLSDTSSSDSDSNVNTSSYQARANARSTSISSVVTLDSKRNGYAGHLVPKLPKDGGKERQPVAPFSTHLTRVPVSNSISQLAPSGQLTRDPPSVQEITLTKHSYMGLQLKEDNTHKVVLVQEVMPNAPEEIRSKLCPGDLILGVNGMDGENLRTVSVMVEALQRGIPDGSTVKLKIQREKKSRQITGPGLSNQSATRHTSGKNDGSGPLNRSIQAGISLDGGQCTDNGSGGMLPTQNAQMLRSHSLDHMLLNSDTDSDSESSQTVPSPRKKKRPHQSAAELHPPNKEQVLPKSAAPVPASTAMGSKAQHDKGSWQQGLVPANLPSSQAHTRYSTTNQARHNMLKVILKAGLKEIAEKDIGGIFRAPPVPDIINLLQNEQNINFSKITDKVNHGRYENLDQFTEDLLMMLTHCQNSYSCESVFFSVATNMKCYVQNDLVPRLKQNISTALKDLDETHLLA